MKLDNEANIQAEFYHACRLIGIQCVLEVFTVVGRLDAVIFNQQRTYFLAIVEVKKEQHRFANGSSKQILRYKQLGVPVYGLSWEKDPHRLAATIKAKHANDPGIAVTAIESMRQIKGNRRQQVHERKVQRLLDAGLNVKSY